MSYAKVFLLFSNSERRSQFGHKVGPAKCENAHRFDTATLLHILFPLLQSCCVHLTTAVTRQLRPQRPTWCAHLAEFASGQDVEAPKPPLEPIVLM